MSEGPNVIQWARRLAPLIGRRLEAVHLSSRFADRAADLVGEHLTAVDTHGKHLLVRLSSGETIHCHGGMHGFWQVGRSGMELRAKPERVRVRLRAAESEAIFFHGPVAELIEADELDGHARLSALGPDVMQADFDRDEAWRRLQGVPFRPIGDAVLDQTVVAGIGNIYKSEGLFLAGVDPRRRVSALDRDLIDRFWLVVGRIMWDEVRTGTPHTLPRPMATDEEHYWVYMRAGRPCHNCRTTVIRIRQGKTKRSSYLCPRCQRAGVALTDSDADADGQRLLPGTF